MLSRLCGLIGLLLLTVSAQAAPYTLTMVTDDVTRTALVCPGRNATKTPSPLLFVYHAFTMTSQKMAALTRFHEAWPEATVVYPQGLTVYIPKMRRSGTGWQLHPGDLGDRDVHFTDALLQEMIRRYKVDTRRVYATGFSNGAVFTYEMYAIRPDEFAAFALVAGSADFLSKVYTPRPFLIIHGLKDRIIPLAMAEATRDAIRRINNCGDQTVEWVPGYLMYQPCRSNMPVIWHTHPGGHIWPADATANIVKFLQLQLLPVKKTR